MGDPIVGLRADRKAPGRATPPPDLLLGLCAGDLEAVSLAVEMAADENLLPCASPEEEGRILAFARRLSESDPLLPRGPGCSG